MVYVFWGWVVLSVLILAYAAYYFFSFSVKRLYVAIKYIVKKTDTFIALVRIPKRRFEQLKHIGTTKHISSYIQKKLLRAFGIVKDEQGDDSMEVSEDDVSLLLSSPPKSQIDPQEEKRIASLVEKILEEALSHKEKGQFVEYEKKLIAGLAIDPANTLCIKKLASWYIYTNNHKKALLLLKRLIEQDQYDHEALWQLGDIYIEQGEFEQALLLVEKAIQLAPDRPKYYVSLAEIKYNMKEFFDAIEYMKKAIQLRPANVNYLLTIAGLYEEVGEVDMARKYYFEVLELEPTNAQAKKKINSL